MINDKHIHANAVFTNQAHGCDVNTGVAVEITLRLKYNKGVY